MVVVGGQETRLIGPDIATVMALDPNRAKHAGYLC